MMKFGHRGLPGYPRKKENLISCFNKALMFNADGLETDVRRCKDKLVLSHDATIDKSTNGHGKLTDYTYEELKEFDAGNGESIPLLQNLLEKFGNHDWLINLELKESGLIEEVADLVLNTGTTSNVILSAFDKDDNEEGSSSNWQELEGFSYNFKTAYLASTKKIFKMGINNFINSALINGVTAIHPQQLAVILMPNLVSMAHDNGLSVNVWTVNNKFLVKYFEFLKVDAIFTDKAEIVLCN